MEITRISDLPDSNNVGVNYSATGNRDNGSRGTAMNHQYQPLNVHQNPYGIPEPTDTQIAMGPSSMGHLSNPNMSNPNMMGPGGGSGGFSGESMQRAPPSMVNRGINQEYQTDEMIQPNHIPSAKLTTDYLREYEDRMGKMNEEHQREKHRKELITSLYDEFQTPILIGVLFFLFQIPMINSLMFKYLNFMKIYDDDGNLNLYGIMLKSILFGLTYFGFVRLTT
jgi:hypothetical protein